MNFFSLLKRNLLYKLKKKISIDNHNIKKKSLDELFFQYGSDKANIFKPAEREGHGFSKFYINQLVSLKDKELNILELGSYAGASAAAFSKYFSNSKVFCFDINISNFKFTSKNIEVYGVDINNKSKILKILNKIFLNHKFKYFDLIIDDGSHKLSDILFSLKFFFEYLKIGGSYVIEDFKHPNYYEYNKDIDDILADKLLLKIKEKKFFHSSTFSKDDQKYLFDNVKRIDIFRGNLKDSDIAFLKK